MNKIFKLILLLSLTSCGLSNDKSVLLFDDGSRKILPIEQKPSEPDKDPKYTKLKTDLFDKSCTGCHNPKKPRRVDLTVKENIIKDYDDILYRMTDAFDIGVDNMPPEGNQVSKDLIEEFKAWKSEISSK